MRARIFYRLSLHQQIITIKKMKVTVSDSDAKVLNADEFTLSTPDDSEFIVRALASEFDTDSLRDSLARDAAADDLLSS